MKNFIMSLFLFSFLFSISVIAQDKKQTDKSTYLVETKHTKEECLAALDAINNKDKALLNKISWGCPEGDHTGYMMVEASSEKEALKELPSEAKKDTEVRKLTKFTPEQIASFHK